jgi:hypothetical protein
VTSAGSDQKALVEQERVWLVKRDASMSETERNAFFEARTKELMYRLTYNGDVVAFKMGRRQGGPSRTGSRRAHI